MDAANNNELPRTCAEAKAIGSKRYFTGLPCKHGHVAPRMTSNRRCIECMRSVTAEWRRNNHEHILEYQRNYESQEQKKARWDAWYAENRETVLGRKRRVYIETRDEQLEYARQYREANPDKAKESTAKWREANPDKVKKAWRAWYEKNGMDRDAERRSTPRGRLDDAVSHGIWSGLKGNKSGKHWEYLVGYTVDDLMAHLKKLFLPGMSFDNYGQFGWHLDHIIPKSAFNYDSPEHIDFKRCWALDNLQPLWRRDNISKGAKLSTTFQPSLKI